MITEVVVCAVLSIPHPADIKDYQHCIEQRTKVEHVEEWLPMIKSYFPKEEWLTASLVMYCESRGNPRAVNHNINGKGIYKNSVDQGLWQWNNITYDWLKKKLKVTSCPFNPYVSTRVTAWAVKHVGWDWWHSSEHCWGDNA